MKILIVSLLRLGDILLHRELARSAKRQYPGSEIHFLIFSQFNSVRSLLPEVDHWHEIDRKSLQRILVERQQSPLAAYQQLEKSIESLNSEKFDMVLNATHNLFSVRLMDILNAGEKRGAALEMGRKTPDSNRWQTYFNEYFSETQGSRFHYLEVLHKSLGLEMTAPAVAEMKRPGVILMQLLTSDSKKNWGLENFRQLKRKLEAEFPESHVLGLCSPDEKKKVSEVFDWNEFLTPTLQEARDLLKESRLLITGDTSIQHLAAQQGCPVVSLFLGSADPVKTAPWQAGAWVIQGEAACVPCSHSSACHQAEHLCAQSLSVDSVFSLISGLLKNRPARISKGSLYQARARKETLVLESEPLNFETSLEQAVWSSYLNGVPADPAFAPAVPLEKARSLRELHEEFRLSVSQILQNKLQFDPVERKFPLWKDSLIRLKRDPRASQEVLQLIEIRSQILNRLCQTEEVSSVGNAKQYASEHFAQA